MGLKPTCAQCRAFYPLTSECRRESPQAFLISAGNGQMKIVGGWPGTVKDNGCEAFVPEEIATS